MTDTLTTAQRSRLMAKVRDRDTTPERVVRRLTHAMGYRYRLHVPELPGRPDLVFPRLRKVIFVHGCFWHQHRCRRGNRIPQDRNEYWTKKLLGNKKRDAAHRRRLRQLGWQTLVIWECETKAKDEDALQAKLAAFLDL